MVQEADWRYENDKKWGGAKLVWCAYKSPTPEWDHDHCVGCGQKFAEVGEPPDVLHAGYRTEDDDWVCPECFPDLAEQLHWTVSGDAPPPSNSSFVAVTVSLAEVADKTTSQHVRPMALERPKKAPARTLVLICWKAKN